MKRPIKKNLAICIGLISPVALAQTNVTIYGVVDVSAQGFSLQPGKAGNYSPTSGRPAEGNTFNLQSNSSLLGFKGEELVGPNLKVLFAAETTLNMTGGGNGVQYGTGTMFGGTRDSYVGASGDFGMVRLGYNSTPLRGALTSFDVMPGATGSSDITRMMGNMRFGERGLSGSNSSTVAQAYDSAIRTTSVLYATPSFLGLNGSIAYSGSNNNGTTNTTDATTCGGSTASRSACSVTPQSTWGLGLAWEGYGVNVKGAFQQSNYNITPNPITNVHNTGDYTSFLVGANYTGVPGLKLSTVYMRNNLQSNGPSNIATGAKILSNNQLWAGASYRFGEHEPRISAVWNSNINGSDDSQYGARQWNFNWGYYLSKRTQIYGLVSYLDNSANQNYALGQQSNNLKPTGGQDLLTYGTGIRTTF